MGNVVAIVLNPDGSAAWIADDVDRTTDLGSLGEVPYFDVWAVDKSGSRQLAAGSDIDPSSLALSVDATNIGHGSIERKGTTVYWTQAGKSFSAPLS